MTVTLEHALKTLRDNEAMLRMFEYVRLKLDVSELLCVQADPIERRALKPDARLTAARDAADAF